MSPSAGAVRHLVVDRPNGAKLQHPVTEASLLEVVTRLAPLVPHDAVWYTTPITPRR